MYTTTATIENAGAVPALPSIVTSERYWDDAAVGFLGAYFATYFLGVKTEATEYTALSSAKFGMWLFDKQIISFLGCDVRLSLSQIARFLYLSKCLYTEPHAYLFYPKELRDWVIMAHWDKDNETWYVEAHEIDFRDREPGYRVIFPRCL